MFVEVNCFHKMHSMSDYKLPNVREPFRHELTSSAKIKLENILP